MQPPVPGIPKRAVVAKSMPCLGCGYNLRGVRVDRDCPECGQPVAETVDAAIDPTAGALPELRNPRAVGNGLLWLMVSQLVATVLIMADWEVSLRLLFDERDSPVPSLPGWSLLVGAGIALSGLLACLVFRSRDERDASVRRSILFLALGLTGVGLFGVAGWVLRGHWLATGDGVMTSRVEFDRLLVGLGMILAAAIVFYGEAGVLHTIGERSRVYREARGGKQGIRGMVFALLFIGLGIVLANLNLIWREPMVDRVAWAGRLLTISCSLMMLIGMGYLVVNAWWIRSALRRPMGRMAQLVRIEPDSTLMAAEDRIPIEDEDSLP